MALKSQGDGKSSCGVLLQYIPLEECTPLCQLRDLTSQYRSFLKIIGVCWNLNFLKAVGSYFNSTPWFDLNAFNYSAIASANAIATVPLSTRSILFRRFGQCLERGKQDLFTKFCSVTGMVLSLFHCSCHLLAFKLTDTANMMIGFYCSIKQQLVANCKRVPHSVLLHPQKEFFSFGLARWLLINILLVQT